jgi:hypothetical protein
MERNTRILRHPTGGVKGAGIGITWDPSAVAITQSEELLRFNVVNDLPPKHIRWFSFEAPNQYRRPSLGRVSLRLWI